jgi:AcrR family transcriptional regulator
MPGTRPTKANPRGLGAAGERPTARGGSEPLQDVGAAMWGIKGPKRGSAKERASTAPVDGANEEPVDAEHKSTRERILDIALDLFTEKGYDNTSLREIAQRLGFSKAALYYHFASKEEILMALHMRLHAIAEENIGAIKSDKMTLASWAALLDSFIDKIPANRKLILMHERNRTAFEKLHPPGHTEEHEDMEERLRSVLSDPATTVRDRIRMGCAFATVMGGLIFGGDTFAQVPPDQLVTELKSAVHDLLGRSRKPGATAPS